MWTGFLLPILISGAAFAAANLDPALTRALDRDGRADALVYLRQAADLQASRYILDRQAKGRFVFETLLATARASQAPLLSELRERQIQYRGFYLENVIAIYGLTRANLRWLENYPDVAAVSWDARAGLEVMPPVGPSVREDLPTHLRVIQVDRVWNEKNVRGKGIVVAAQDTGFYWEHSALRRQYRGAVRDGHDYSWHDAIAATAAPQPFDDNGHGTHVIGTLIGDGGAGARIGVAPEAQWIGCRNMNKGVGTVSSYIECFEFFLAPYRQGESAAAGKPELAPHIVNNSWSCPAEEGCTGGELLRSVQALRAAGIFVVTVAGNGGPNCESASRSPGFYSGEVFSVGAYNRYQKDIAYFSGRGPSTWNGGLVPNVIAYGDVIRSAWIGGPDKYEDKGGTSMAAPQIAGVVALLWSGRPELVGQVERTEAILQKTARPLLSSQSCGSFPGGSVPNAVFGHGLVDAFAAFNSP